MGRRLGLKSMVIGAGALALAACGGGSSGDDASGGDTTAPVRNATTSNPITLPTYRVVSNGLTQTQIAAVNKALDPLMPTGVDLALGAGGRLGYAEPTALLVGTKQFTRTTAPASQDDEKANGLNTIGWDPVAVKALQPMSTTAMTSLVSGAASTLKQGDTGALVTTGPVNLEMYNPSTKTMTLTKQVATVGGRTSKLSGYPLVGPGNAFDLLVGGSGKLAFVNIQQRSYAVSTNVQVPSGADAVARCKAALETERAGSSTGVTLTASLVYFAPSLSETVTTIEPALQCDGVATNGLRIRTMFVRARLDMAVTVIVPGAGFALKGLLDNDVNGLELGTSYLQANARSALRHTGPSTTNYETVMTAWGMDLRVNLDDTLPDATFDAGTDVGANGADSVDMFWYTGHANGLGWQTDTGLNNVNTMRLGNADLEWLVVAACGPLQDTEDGQTWQDRLTPLFQGLHLLFGYATTSNDTPGEGTAFAVYSIFGRYPPSTLEKPALLAAWVFTAIENQPSNVRWGIAGSQSNSASSAGDCLNCAQADIAPADAGFGIWRLVGPS